MNPTLNHGDRVLVRRVGKARRGSLIVFNTRPLDDTTAADIPFMVKRLVATTGDHIPTEFRPPLGPISDERVATGCYLVRGDNERSEDSRKFGYLTVDELCGVVMRIMRD